MAVERQIARIVTVEPGDRRVDGVLRDRSIVPIEVREVPALFRWPVEGEQWSVNRRGQGSWQLGERLEMGEQELSIEELEPGQAKIASEEIFDDAGRRVISAEGDPEEGEVLMFGGAHWFSSPIPVGSGDLHLPFSQDVPSDTWVIPHELSKYPSVTVVNSAGDETFGDVHFDSIAQVTVRFSGDTSGKAYLN